jgi:cell division protein FtsZ
MAVMLLSAMGGEVSRFAAAAPLAAQPEPAAAAPEPVVNFVAEDPAPVPAEPMPELVVLPTPEPPRVAARVAAVARPVRANDAAAIEAAKAREREVKQEQLSFEPVTRGRFEKSEPTIVDGQDLDVPAFMRRNVRLK